MATDPHGHTRTFFLNYGCKRPVCVFLSGCACPVKPVVYCFTGVAKYFIFVIWLLVAIGVLLLPFSVKPADAADDILTLIGPKDAILVTAPDGSIILAANETTRRVPASTLKLLTSLVALHYLGPEYRFPTDFFMDENQNLKIKGYGDPLLISEIIDKITQKLARDLSTINDIVLDDTYFSQPIDIPGRSVTRNPYDAPNGALCVNFNTIKFKKDSNGRYVSAEPQTPLLPFVLPKIRASGINANRIVLSHHHNENVLYAGHLFIHFLNRHGVQCHGTVRTGKIKAETDRLILRHASPTLEEIIAKLLEHSSNYTANQLLITTGARVQGAPGNLQKGVQAALTYASDVLGLEDIRLVEGSGISRLNLVSARDMIRILAAFKPYRHLMMHTGREYFKTGSLNGIRTRAGYIERAKGGWYRFVVMMNTPGKSAEKVVRLLLNRLP